MRILPVLPAIAATLGLCTPPAAGAADVEAVTLSTQGTALVEARGPLGTGPLRLEVGRDDIDDFLKSLRIDDPEGAVPRLNLQGPAGASKIFDQLPFGPGELTDRAALLGAMVGARLQIERDGGSETGRNMGVTQRPCEYGPCPVLTLRHDDGKLREYPLDEELAVRFADAEEREMITRALDAVAARDGQASVGVEIVTDSSVPRDARLAWLQDVPAWRTAYRAIDTGEELRLLGWAVVENTTGQDWDEIELTLATGAVRTLDADLYGRPQRTREQTARLQPAPEPAMMGASLPSAESGDAMQAAETTRDEGRTFSRYTLGEPVTLAAGEMVSLPFLDETLENARMLLYRGGSGAEHPVVAARLRNPLPLRLPGGVLTLYEAGRGHAGDARLPEMAAGGTTIAEFATDTAVEVRQERRRDGTITEMRVADGVLRVSETAERRTIYRVEGAPDVAHTVTIAHPRTGGWTVASPEPTRAELDAWHYELSVPADARARLEVVEQQPRQETVALLDIGSKHLTEWMRRAPDQESRALLEELARLRREQADATDRARRLEQREDELIEEQKRLLDIVTALGDENDANAGRRARIDEIDTEITDTRAARRDARDRAEELEDSIRALISG